MAALGRVDNTLRLTVRVTVRGGRGSVDQKVRMFVLLSCYVYWKFRPDPWCTYHWSFGNVTMGKQSWRGPEVGPVSRRADTMHWDRAGPVLVIIHRDDLVPRKAGGLAAESPNQEYLLRHTRTEYPAAQCTAGSDRPVQVSPLQARLAPGYGA